MIFFLVTRRGAHTFRDYIPDWSGALRPEIAVMTYDTIATWPAPVAGTYVFTDIERLTEKQLAACRDYATYLESSVEGIRILNHPGHATRRLELLNALHRDGLNQFDAYRLGALPKNIRFPAFLRLEREHNGPGTPLLQDRGALVAQALRLALKGHDLDEFLAVEFCETVADDSWYRKYSAFRIGGHVIPGHVIFSQHWIAKDGEPDIQALHDEEYAYMAHNPHTAFLERIFDRAGIQYGRIDYSMLGDTPQVWEINTNPVLIKSRETYEKQAPSAIPKKEILAETLRSLFDSINTPNDRRSDREGNIPRQISLEPLSTYKTRRRRT